MKHEKQIEFDLTMALKGKPVTNIYGDDVKQFSPIQMNGEDYVTAVVTHYECGIGFDTQLTYEINGDLKGHGKTSHTLIFKDIT